MIGDLTNHLWQSTLFAGVAGLLKLVLRKNRAQTRYWLWFAASVKFLVPFSILVMVGHQWGRPIRTAIPESSLSYVIEQVSQPFAVSAPILPMASVQPTHASFVSAILITVWVVGFLTLLCSWCFRWRRIRAAMNRASPLHLLIEIQVMSSDEFPEPGVFGIRRPVVLLHAGITRLLTPPQLEAILAHELCHVRRRDNLATAVHMSVEALFWFHPLVWWLGARLMEERERACDEAVLRLGNEPQVYAEAILKICELYVQSPLQCVAGVTGANLKRRIEAIMNNRVVFKLNFAKRVTLALAGIASLGLPVGVGIMNAPILVAQSRNQSASPAPRAPAPPVVAQETVPRRTVQSPAAATPAYLNALGVVAADTVSTKPLIEGQVISVGFKEGDLVQRGQLLASIDRRPFEVQLAQAKTRLARDQAYVNDARRTQDPVITHLDGILIDQANIEIAARQLAYTQILAPITGVAGKPLVEPGNTVHAEDPAGIVIITRLQPITVLFDVPEDRLPRVLASLRENATLPVEVWSTDNTMIAIGRLSAVDNQIDPATGTAKFKALFDNKDGALLPNQRVSVRVPVGDH